jgi:hypothetical protein
VDFLRIGADEEGETHLERVVLGRVSSPAEHGVAPLLVAEGIAVDRVHFVTVRADDQAPDWHCAPRRQFVVFLDGWVRVVTSDGDECRLPAGGVVLAEDLVGRGHVTEHEPGDRRVLVIPRDPSAPS